VSTRRLIAIASLGSLGLAGIGVAAVANRPGHPSDDPGVRREVSAAADVTGETSARDEDDLAMPPYLMAQSPGHLEGEIVESTTSPPQAISRTSAPTTPIATASPTTTTVAVTTTTTTAPVTTPTLPAKKSDEPDGSPQAIDDTYTIAVDQIAHLYVLDNDSDPDGGLSNATLSLVSGPAHAQRFTLVGDYFRYRSYPPTSGQFGAEDSFVYELCDETGLCTTASVAVFVEAG
jgi:hypothetical protein